MTNKIKHTKNAIIQSEVNAQGNVHVGDVHYHISAPLTSTSPTENEHNFQERIRSLISQNNIKESVVLLIEYTKINQLALYDECILLSGAWESLAQQERMGLIGIEDFIREQGILRKRLMDICSMLII